MKITLNKHRLKILVILAVAFGLFGWSLAGGMPLAQIKYRAGVAVERISSLWASPSPRMHPALDDQSVAGVGTTGRPQVIDFYAEWCPACRVLTPALQDLGEKYKGRVDVIHIDVDSPLARSLRARFQVKALPTLYFLDQNGEQVDMVIGGTAPEQVEANIKSLLGG